MTLSDYQQESKKTAIYPNVGQNFVYPTLGLAGEAGEIANKVKKILRDKDSQIDVEDQKEIGKELGDVLWYLAQIATELNLSLDEIAQNNLTKLLSRQERNVLGGNGDNR
ncbi:MAG: nucleoside triphosphate pyrophosphohydrolase family protein [Patescibacteria group bacterium]|jgi:NTP pyrophosphatase (non-canonical NTP hydrolase)